MFTSGPLWAIICAHMCNNYTNYTLLTSLPTFMKEVIKLDIKEVRNVHSQKRFYNLVVIYFFFGRLMTNTG